MRTGCSVSANRLRAQWEKATRVGALREQSKDVEVLGTVDRVQTGST